MTRRSASLLRWTVWAVLGSQLVGCDQLGIETPAKLLERQEAEAKAIGSACRHAMRAIEDCYVLNPKAEKSSVFNGWREMDEYMRENKLDGVAPTVPRPALPGTKPKKKADDDSEVEAETVEDEPASAPAKAKTEGASSKPAASGAAEKNASAPAKSA